MPENCISCIYEEAKELKNKAEISSDGWDDQVKERFHSGPLEQLYNAAFLFHTNASSHVQNMRKQLAEIEEFYNRIKHFS
jgi:hypothetical protein